MIIQGNTFDGNQAIIDKLLDTLTSRDQYTYRGGAIYLKCFKNTDEDCNISLEKRNVFRNNKALIQGGAISVMSAGYVDD